MTPVELEAAPAPATMDSSPPPRSLRSALAESRGAVLASLALFAVGVVLRLHLYVDVSYRTLRKQVPGNRGSDAVAIHCNRRERVSPYQCGARLHVDGRCAGAVGGG